MPIAVTCPECQYHFLVGDEFAGRPGRCPECAAIIDVPGPDPRALPPSHEPRDRSPYETRRAADSFEDDFPSRLRRRRRDDDRDRYEPDEDADYQERRPGRVGDDGARAFDAHARARKWASVAGGLRNLMVAVILMTCAGTVASVFELIDPVRPGQQNALTPKDKAIAIGNLVFIILALLLWGYGRIGCGRVPYVPARRIALPAGVIAGLSAILGVFAFAGMGVGILMIVQNPAGAGGIFLLLGCCALLPVFVGLPVAEFMGLLSQLKMAAGLRDAAFARAARVQLVVAILLTGLFFAGLCTAFVFAMGVQQKAIQKQEEERRQQQAAQVGAPKDGGPAAKGGPKAQGPANNGANGQPPPPEFDVGEHPELVYGVAIFRLLILWPYAAVSVVACQLGRRAVRREIDQLVGDPHDRDRPRDEHY
jgi:hypothetical protein